MNFMIIEWFDAVDGGLWQIIAFAHNLQDTNNILKTRKSGSKLKIINISLCGIRDVLIP